MARFSTYSVNPNMFDMSFGSFAGLPPAMRNGLGYALQLAEMKLKNAYLESLPGTKEFAAAHPLKAESGGGVTIPAPSKPGAVAAPRGGGGGGGAPSLPGARGTQEGLNLAGTDPSRPSNVDVNAPLKREQNPGTATSASGADISPPAPLAGAEPGADPSLRISSSPKSIDKNLMTKVDKERMTTADREEINKSPSNFAQYGKAVGQGLQGAVDLTEEEEEVTEDSLMNYFGNAATGVLKTPFGGQ